MDKVVGGFAAAFGRGLAEGLGAVIVLVVLIGLAIFLVAMLSGLILGLLALRFYRRGRPRAFLIASIFATIFLSFVTALIGSGKIADNLSLAPIIFIALLIAGSILIYRAYKKLKSRAVSSAAANR